MSAKKIELKEASPNEEFDLEQRTLILSPKFGLARMIRGHWVFR
jgi:hypothetical protein